MSKLTPTSGSSSWEPATPTPEFLAKHSPETIETWQALTLRVIGIAALNGWTKAEVARRSGIAEGTFSQWASGKYPGSLASYNDTIARWLDSVEEMASVGAGIPQSPPFNPKMRGAIEIFETLTWAQVTADLVMITQGAGMGKTETCKHYRATRPHVFRAAMTDSNSKTHGMLVLLAEQLEVQEYNPAKLVGAIGRRLARIGGGSLLIVDEAQQLADDAINQLRHFVDEYKCGVALVGNDEVYSRFAARKAGGRSYAQLKSRVGKRLKRTAPYREDLLSYIAAWGVTDPECTTFLVGVGSKGGAFRQIEKTMKLAMMIAYGSGETVSLKHIQAAWKNRDVEDMA